ncbi:OsmC family protein [Heyndrickxia ginsengihumi]|uniref:OsmC family protein n=1 Tax=Heyndrickxia ginsengihumi TaxID=363870 RepID=A0A0A6V9L7_9BACI|nr:OsmC family protein [Heyndrickxia ginsengihumi]KHD84860.1 hypothetical protein NG54_12675 [Heyndrickxia ginsengihumi]MBE6183603.1 OsmC family protein [Bacillus sp. (in: firmicutes)]MCM3024962.1 OsmC family protein [Heyndrickxia ginsengihumi]NEY18746.1 OsmC family protein [Heyndrickxia ginsengihumi]
MAEHHFYLHADWPGGRNEVGQLKAGNLHTNISIPPEMDGPGIGTNPDEMLLGASATCYIITLAAMLERSNITPLSLTIDSEAIVEVERGVNTFKKIIHRPTIVLPYDVTEVDEKKVHRFVTLSEERCMISKALKGNVEIALEPDIQIAQ